MFNTDAMKLMSTDVIESRISNTFKEKISLLMQKLTKIDHVSTSTNVISIGAKRFLGMTVHWIDSDSLEQESHALCFKQFTPPHSIDRLESLITTINQNFGIQEKIVGTATSNRCDLISVFKALGITFDDESCENVMNDEGVEDVTECEELARSVEFEVENTDNFMIPGQYRCASQHLKLLLTIDANQALKNASYAVIFSSSMRKLNQLFQLTKRDEVKKEMKTNDIAIEPPSATQWESLFQSIRSAVKYDMDVINKLMDTFNAPTFTVDELSFLKEYLTVTEPIIESLDNLQSNELYAFLLPTLKTLRDHLESSQETELKFCAPLFKAIHSGFNERFREFFDLKNEKCTKATIAACTHPFFKLRWIDADFMGTNYFNQINDLIIDAVQKCNSNSEENTSTSAQNGKQRVSQLFFMIPLFLMNFLIAIPWFSK